MEATVLFQSRVAELTEHMLEAQPWEEAVLTAYPAAVLVQAANAMARTAELDVYDTVYAAKRLGANLSPATRHLVEWAFVARANLQPFLNVMRPLVAVLHVTFRDRLHERAAEDLGALHTLVLHITSAEKGRLPVIEMRGYRTCVDAEGQLIVGGYAGQVLKKSVLEYPIFKDGQPPPYLCGTQLGVSLQQSRSPTRLDVLNVPIFCATTRMLAALRAAAHYRQVSHEVDQLAAGQGVTAQTLFEDMGNTRAQGALRRREDLRTLYMENSTPEWQRFLVGHGLDAELPADAVLVDCHGAHSPCTMATADDLRDNRACLLEDVTHIARRARVTVDGYFVRRLSRCGAGWHVEFPDGCTSTLSHDAYLARFGRVMVPQVFSVRNNALYSAYARTPTVEDLQFKTPQGVAVDLGSCAQ